MKKLLALIACKLARYIGKFLGKGSSMPGKIALKICPDILSKIKLPKYIVAVTGSNGKTSTVEMIANVLLQNGYKVSWNKEGSNQIEGVTTLILNDANFLGKIKSDVLLIESDERYAKYTFKYFKPTHFVITNLYRDQLTRNGNPLWVYNSIKEAIFEETQLILNADDPYVSSFGLSHNNNIWFGIDKNKYALNKPDSIYNDGKYCPNCGYIMNYEYIHYAHIGKYSCTNCNLKKNDTSFSVTDIDLDNNNIIINDKNYIQLAFNSMYNIYNILAAYSVCSLIGVEEDKICSYLSNFILKNGRILKYKLGLHNGILLASKHENSISYDMSLKYVRDYKKECSVIIYVDAISRKYFTGETSWLWDINFDFINAEHIKNIFLCGTYYNDLAVRFSYTNIDNNKIQLFNNISDLCNELKNNGSEDLFTITCFSDKGKFIPLVEVE